MQTFFRKVCSSTLQENRDYVLCFAADIQWHCFMRCTKITDDNFTTLSEKKKIIKQVFNFRYDSTTLKSQLGEKALRLDSFKNSRSQTFGITIATPNLSLLYVEILHHTGEVASALLRMNTSQWKILTCTTAPCKCRLGHDSWLNMRHVINSVWHIHDWLSLVCLVTAVLYLLLLPKSPKKLRVCVQYVKSSFQSTSRFYHWPLQS